MVSVNKDSKFINLEITLFFNLKYLDAAAFTYKNLFIITNFWKDKTIYIYIYIYIWFLIKKKNDSKVNF